MTGFPTRPSRATFGPTPENRYPVVDPAYELDADIGDLMMWQTAGLGAISASAWAFVHYTAPATVAVTYSAEAWDADGAYVPTVSRTGAGDYTVTWAATYPDKDAVSQTLSLLWARAHPQSASALSATAVIEADRHSVRVYIYDAAGAATDADVVVEVF